VTVADDAGNEDANTPTMQTTLTAVTTNADLRLRPSDLVPMTSPSNDVILEAPAKSMECRTGQHL
jgi:hypothetical protein